MVYNCCSRLEGIVMLDLIKMLLAWLFKYFGLTFILGGTFFLFEYAYFAYLPGSFTIKVLLEIPIILIILNVCFNKPDNFKTGCKIIINSFVAYALLLFAFGAPVLIILTIAIILKETHFFGL